MANDLSPPEQAVLRALHYLRQFGSGRPERHRRSTPAYVLAAALEIDHATLMPIIIDLIDRGLIEDITDKVAERLRWIAPGDIGALEHWPPAGKYNLPESRSIEVSRTIIQPTHHDHETSRNVIIGVKAGGDWETAGTIIGTIVPDTCRLFKLTGRGCDVAAELDDGETVTHSFPPRRAYIRSDGTIEVEVLDEPEPRRSLSDGNGHSGKKKTPVGTRGRRRIGDPESDARHYDNWIARDPGLTMTDFALARGFTLQAFQKLVDRERQRRSRTPRNPR